MFYIWVKHQNCWCIYLFRTKFMLMEPTNCRHLSTISITHTITKFPEKKHLQYKTQYKKEFHTQNHTLALVPHFNYFSSNKSDVQDNSDDSSSCFAKPKPCHRILPKLSSKNIYLWRAKRNRKQASEQPFLSGRLFTKPRKRRRFIPSEKVQYFNLFPEVIMVSK